MLQNITGSPRTTIVGILAGLFGLASALGHLAGLPPTVATVCGIVATVATLGLGLFGVDPSTLLASQQATVAANARKGAP
jgi:uncharacterized membrane protein